MSKISENEHNCHDCKAMCFHFPCGGSVAEIEKLISEGFGASLMLYEAYDQHLGKQFKRLMPAIKGFEGGYLYGRNTPYHVPCVFLDEDHLCRLHDLKLKPVEGRIAECDSSREKRGITYESYREAYDAFKAELNDEWTTERGVELVESWRAQFYKPENNFRGDAERI